MQDSGAGNYSFLRAKAGLNWRRKIERFKKSEIKMTSRNK